MSDHRITSSKELREFLECVIDKYYANTNDPINYIDTSFALFNISEHEYLSIDIINSIFEFSKKDCFCIYTVARIEYGFFENPVTPYYIKNYIKLKYLLMSDSYSTGTIPPGFF